MKHILALLALPTGLAASSAQAATAADRSTWTIPYDDSGLRSVDGLKSLLRRIDFAAGQACLDPTGPSPAATVNLVCRDEAVRNAHQQLADAVTRPRP
jgi:UrcA family protein